MPLEIHIKTEYDDPRSAAEQVDEMLAALGFVRDSQTTSFALSQLQGRHKEPSAGDGLDAERVKQAEPGPDTRGVMNVGLEHAEAEANAVSTGAAQVMMRAADTAAQVIVRATAPLPGPDPDYTHPSGRKFGQPGPGGKRRTKAEMAEDTAYLASLNDISDMKFPVADYEREKEKMLAAGRKEKEYLNADERDLIDSAEDAENAEQDAADEAAEAGAEQTGVLDLEDLRREIGLYAKKHGMAKASANIPAIIEGPMLEVTDFERAVARVRLATATGDGLLHEEPKVTVTIHRADSYEVQENPHATKDDLMEAVMAYAAKFEGKGVKPASGGPTAVDLADVMRKTFPGTSGALSEIPATPEGYGKALGAVNAAITGNPYERAVK